jgi:hypothetical protein
MRLLWLVVGSLLLTHSSDGRGQDQKQNGQSETATVHIMLVDVYGKEVAGKASVELFKGGPKETNLAGRFKDNVAVSIPYGIYGMRVYARGFWPSEREVRVFQPEVWAVVALAPGVEGGPDTSKLSGQLHNMGPSGQPFHIRLSGVYWDVAMDALVNNSGTFELAKIPIGIYTLVVTQQGQVKAVRVIRLPLSDPAPIVIDVGQKESATTERSDQDGQ